MKDSVIHLGLAGLGTVGSGLIKIIQENNDWIERRLGKTLTVKTIMVRDLDKSRNVIPSPDTTFTTSMDDLINDPEIDIIVELAGGIEFPRTLITRALGSGKSVVTANKALLAEHGPELFELAASKNLGLYYEASVAGGIPIIQTLKESLAGNRIKALTGILNGTANFIMSEMSEKGEDFATVLGKAQAKGYAEADPTLDVEGIDAAHKLVILIRLAYGQDYPMSKLTVEGISKVEQFDIILAKEFGYRLKLLAQVRDKSGMLHAGVYPALLRQDHILAKVDGPFNSILLEGNAVGPVMLYGQGAGDLPTGSAVLADILALARTNCVPNNTGFLETRLPQAQILAPELTVFRHYFRFTVVDRPGVMASIAGVMGEYNISIAQVVQRQYAPNDGVPIVFISHSAQMQNVTAALDTIKKFSFVLDPPVHYRII
ncbi:MAG: homoserine dehydrogenase [Desulfomicrobium apsheronum]|nr:homoserine dehydrogenase [Desulfomicrobium apsheronum]